MDFFPCGISAVFSWCMWQFPDDTTTYWSISRHKVNDTWKYKFVSIFPAGTMKYLHMLGSVHMNIYDFCICVIYEILLFSYLLLYKPMHIHEEWPKLEFFFKHLIQLSKLFNLHGNTCSVFLLTSIASWTRGLNKP